MSWFKTDEKRFADAISALSYCNPFLPERIEYEKEALGDAFVTEGSVWNLQPLEEFEHSNVTNLRELCEGMIEKLCGRLKGGEVIGEDDSRRYVDLVTFVLYHRYRVGFDRMIAEVGDAEKEMGAQGGSGGRARMRLYEPFYRDATKYLEGIDGIVVSDDELAHLFACFFQVRRAFHHIYEFILGTSRPMVQLRAAVWQSIFTHDLRRYKRVLYKHMGDISTLVTGPSGTGKELVARAVGLSRYIPFNHEKQQFTEQVSQTYFPLNLSAMSPTLIESELFGHCKGAYTGAVSDRVGWLEICPSSGTVFLDEIGELDTAIQVKLLRVLQTRTFSRLGETKERPFKGKIITATNRDMAKHVQTGEIREDFYYRLCSDRILLPSLAERLKDKPEELSLMVNHITTKIVGEEGEALSVEIEQWINENLGAGYGWPGNVRELEQCIRNILIRQHYEPPAICAQATGDKLVDVLNELEISAEELLQAYCRVVYGKTGSYEQAARLLGLDRRTVKSKVEAGEG